jgi:hypothetical protein
MRLLTRPRYTTLRTAPERLAIFQQSDAWPLPPPSWQVLTDQQWAELQLQFDLPNIVGGVNIRTFLEIYCRAIIDCRTEKQIQDRCRLDDKTIRWMSRASNIGKSYRGTISESVICRLSLIAAMLNRAAGGTLITLDELNRAGALTIPVQFCALVCWELGRPASVHSLPPAIIEFYAALWRCWEEFLGRRPVKLWAHEGGRGASAFVKFATHLLRLSQEPLSDDDAVARKNVRGRLGDMKRFHGELLGAHDQSPKQVLTQHLLLQLPSGAGIIGGAPAGRAFHAVVAPLSARDNSRRISSFSDSTCLSLQRPRL